MHNMLLELFWDSKKKSKNMQCPQLRFEPSMVLNRGKKLGALTARPCNNIIFVVPILSYKLCSVKLTLGQKRPK